MTEKVFVHQGLQGVEKVWHIKSVRHNSSMISAVGGLK